MPPLSSDDRRALLSRARHAIVASVARKKMPGLPAPTGPLSEPCGAFVTLYYRSHLHGCVGRSDRVQTLAETVEQCARGAALHDARFPTVTSDEINQLEIEVSVLSELRPILPAAIRVGVHGIVVSLGLERALLLPQVATEHRWSMERFLEETCRKAGLAPDAWRDPKTELLGFTAETFSDADFDPK